MDDLISVIVPVHNVEKYLDRCINSIISQTYKNLEILLIDDGSTDNSGNICDFYAESDTRIKVYHVRNGGLSYARNIGIKSSLGKYISFVDSDDWIEPYIYEKAYKEIKNHSVDVVVWGFFKDFVDSNEKEKSTIKVLSSKFICSKENSNNSVLLDDNKMSLIGYAWNKLYKKNVIEKNGLLFEEGTSLIEDMLFNVQYFIKSNAVMFIDVCGNHYMQRDTKTLGSKFYPNCFELKIRACREKENLFKAYNVINYESFILQSKFYALLSSYKAITKNKELSRKEKKKYIKVISRSEEAKAILKKYKGFGKQIIYKILILTKQFWIFEVM